MEKCEYCGALDGIHANHCPGIHSKSKTFTVVECRELQYNWRQEKEQIDNLIIVGPKFETYKVDDHGVVKIEEIGDGSFKVSFDDGGFEQIYNPNRAKWESIKDQRKVGLSGDVVEQVKP